MGERNRIVRAIDALFALDGMGVSVSGGCRRPRRQSGPEEGRQARPDPCRTQTPVGNDEGAVGGEAQGSGPCRGRARRETGAWPSPDERSRQKKDRRGAESKMGRAEKAAAKKAPVAKKAEAAAAAAAAPAE